MLLTGLTCFLALSTGIQSDIVYSRAGGEELKMDISMPERSNPAGNAAIVVIHGGAWVMGNRKDMVPLAQMLAKEGFVTASVSYRLGPKHKYPAMIDDVQTAVRFLRANAKQFQIDPKRIGATGTSAGGHLSLLLGMTDTRDTRSPEHSSESSKVQAVLNFFGPSDMRLNFAKSLDFVYPMVLGKPKEQAAEEIKAASPVLYATEDDAPIFTIHGDADTVVDVQHAKILDDVLSKHKIERQTEIIPGMGHTIDRNNPKCADALKKAISWLKLKLKVS